MKSSMMVMMMLFLMFKRWDDGENEAISCGEPPAGALNPNRKPADLWAARVRNSYINPYRLG